MVTIWKLQINEEKMEREVLWWSWSAAYITEISSMFLHLFMRWIKYMHINTYRFISDIYVKTLTPYAHSWRMEDLIITCIIYWNRNITGATDQSVADECTEIDSLNLESKSGHIFGLWFIYCWPLWFSELSLHLNTLFTLYLQLWSHPQVGVSFSFPFGYCCEACDFPLTLSSKLRIDQND